MEEIFWRLGEIQNLPNRADHASSICCDKEFSVHSNETPRVPRHLANRQRLGVSFSAAAEEPVSSKFLRPLWHAWDIAIVTTTRITKSGALAIQFGIMACCMLSRHHFIAVWKVNYCDPATAVASARESQPAMRHAPLSVERTATFSIMPATKSNLLLTMARRGPVRARDLDEAAIPRAYLRRLSDRGLHRLADAVVTEHHSLVEASKRVPHGIVCLLSALHFHELTTEVPHAVWLMIDAHARPPTVRYPTLEIVRASGAARTEGPRTGPTLQSENPTQ